ncbi:MAG: single-stranded-DNA-specific exonuclease RecJ [Gammaproteobacteria bacterium]|nr:single-stranded-DNA-specific exonuclease RecJ [Gammaproteobacteria bacterium]MCI0590877.1 single-stranded-DNA-specific exonuclease RecJ [Gammaproteobacteria bacterium]
MRNVASAEELDYALLRLAPYEALFGIDRAASLLARALKMQQRILIVADFDADGATSCAVAIRGLRLLGAQDVRYVVPNRFEYGYGLTPEIVAVAAEQGPSLLITVDNGISSIDGVRAAKDRGIQVLITDHHLPGERLPEADAIVNPNQSGDAFPSKNLAGVGVMFYMLLALRARLRQTGWFDKRATAEPNLAQLLDLVALGTVADVVPLDHNNRILVFQGVQRIRKGRCQPGIRALVTASKRDRARVVANDLAFALGPRLNAAGRLTDMSLGIECLLADDETSAMRMAQQLDALNQERREIEGQMHDQALASLAKLDLDEPDGLPFGMCLFDESWHQGVIGILASRIKDRLNRPVIAFALDGADELKGSARSVRELHIRDVLDAVATRHPGLILRFGGHAMAAGLSLKRNFFDDFKTAFDEEVRQHLNAEALQGVIYSDGELEPNMINLELVERIRNAGPWGQGFPEPVFDGEFEIVDRRMVGGRHLKLRLSADGAPGPMDAIAFNISDKTCPEEARRVHIAYRLDVNVYQGRESPQLVIDHMHPVGN